MIDIATLKVFILEDQYPFFTDSQLEAICNSSSSINEAAYTACKMKAKSDKVKIGPIEIDNDSKYWNTLADSFFDKWQREGSTTGRGKSITGLCIGRADEY